MSKMQIQFKDGDTYDLCPVAFDVFSKYFPWEGSDDMAFDKWKRENNYYELSDFNEDALKNSILIYTDVDRERVIKFRLIEDSDKENYIV